MATYLDYLSFVNTLKWYKRWFLPRFLNDAEKKEYYRIVDSEKTELDYAKDCYFFSWNEYHKRPDAHKCDLMLYWKREVERLMEKKYREEFRERYETDDPGGDN